MRSRWTTAAMMVLVAGCGDRAPGSEVVGQGDGLPGAEGAVEAAAIPVDDTVRRSRLLRSVSMRCSDGTEVMASYWDLPAARVVLSSHDGLAGVLPQLPAVDEDDVLPRYGDSAATWTPRGDSAVYQAGSRRLNCWFAEGIEF